ncbi:MAG: helix-turn-helix domain-containing protein [Oscillospiraceae bacterium]|nr:helix-turn-helix domain-containing protein [Oscillospiraceae bacterium]
MNFGETIKKLRRQKDMTQEQLAEYLNISTQAVSRWETNSSLPDITLIPMIANIFDVSADVLLGIDVTMKEKRIQDIIDSAEEYHRYGYNLEKAVETLRIGLKEYPNSYKIMGNLMNFIYTNTAVKEIEEKSELTAEIIRLGEKILSECTDDEIRHSAIQTLCYAYPLVGETEKALKLAYKMPKSNLSRENLFVKIFKGTEQFVQKQYKLFYDISAVIEGLFPFRDTLDDGGKPYTAEECIILNQKVIDFINLIFDDGYSGAFRNRAAWAYEAIAENYASLEDYEKAIMNLKLAAEQIILCDEEADYAEKADEYTALPFRGMKMTSHFVGPEKFYINSLLKIIADCSAFDAIRDNKDFIEIEERLKKYAKKR